MTNLTSGLEAGDTVQVLPWPELRATLDPDGTLDRLPFMPEMVRFCGRTFVVTRRINTTCDELDGHMRKIERTVYLDGLRCDGSEHGGCQKNCALLWKDAWLRQIEPGSDLTPSAGGCDAGACFRPPPDGPYVCQATELNAATTPLRWRDVGTIVRGLRAHSESPLDLARTLALGISARMAAAAFGTPYRYLPGKLTRTPRATLNLLPGELVRVKDKAAIVATLDKDGKNRGLQFTAPMAAFCGGTYRVLGRLDRMIDERRRALIRLEDTVLLEKVTCNGRHVLRGGCPRANYYYWREIWLERAADIERRSPETQ